MKTHDKNIYNNAEPTRAELRPRERRPVDKLAESLEERARRTAMYRSQDDAGQEITYIPRKG